MAHVQISQGDEGTFRLVVDGADISKAVIANSVHVSFDAITVGGCVTPTVQLALFAHDIDLDLPDSILQAFELKEGEGDE